MAVGWWAGFWSGVPIYSTQRLFLCVISMLSQLRLIPSNPFSSFTLQTKPSSIPHEELLLPPDWFTQSVSYSSSPGREPPMVSCGRSPTGAVWLGLGMNLDSCLHSPHLLWKIYFSLHSSEVNFLTGEIAALIWAQIAIGRTYCNPFVFLPTVAKFISVWPWAGKLVGRSVNLGFCSHWLQRDRLTSCALVSPPPVCFLTKEEKWFLPLKPSALCKHWLV